MYGKLCQALNSRCYGLKLRVLTLTSICTKHRILYQIFIHQTKSKRYRIKCRISNRFGWRSNKVRKQSKQKANNAIKTE